MPNAGTPPQLNAALCAERSKQSYEAPLRECQTELNKTAMATSMVEVRGVGSIGQEVLGNFVGDPAQSLFGKSEDIRSRPNF